MNAPRSADEDAMALGMELAKACAPAFVFMQSALTAEQRVDFVRAFFCVLSGMAEQSIGYTASREVIAFAAALNPVASAAPLQ